jgi:hypothetical protein
MCKPKSGAREPKWGDGRCTSSTASVLARVVFPVLAVFHTLPADLDAQSGHVNGRVTDSAGTPLKGVLVSAPRFSRNTTTSDSGRFDLTLPTGRHSLAFRRVGFAPSYDSVSVVDGAITEQTFTILHRTVQLDTVSIVKPLSAQMRGFEDRRHHNQGTFITADELQKAANRPLRSVLGKRLTGVTFVNYRGAIYVSSTRGMTQVDRRLRIRAVQSDPRSPVGCWPQIYLDGTRMYAPNGGSDALDLNDFQTRDMEAIEFYSGGANTPPEFGSMFSTCGTLVMWTRLP